MARVRVKGIPSLRRKLIALKEKTLPDIRPAMEQAANRITDMMRRVVPVGQGDLLASIGWTWGEAPRGSVSVSARAGQNKITIFAGNEKAFYARWVEFGTAPHEQGGKFAGTDHPGTAAQPFFFPSFRANRREVKRMITRAIRDAMRKNTR